jgi:hypothetical protein
MLGLFGLQPTGIGILVSFIRNGQTLESLNSYSIIAGALDGSFTAIFFLVVCRVYSITQG